MTPSQEIKAEAGGATPRPWKADGETVTGPNGDPIKLESGWVEDAWIGDSEAQANAALIVEAVNAWNDIEALKRRIAELSHE